MQLTFKKMNLPSVFKYSFCVIKNKKIFLLKTKSLKTKYIVVPSYVFIKKKKNVLEFLCFKINSKKFLVFLNNFLLWLKTTEKPVRVKLFLKGLGYRISFSSDKKSLIFKLGFSHLKEIQIPENIFIIIKKNKLSFEGVHLSEVKNFVEKIISLKYPDKYKGKGFWYKNQKISLKPINKK